MKQLQPVIWTKGTLLTPQHLQVQDRYAEDIRTAVQRAAKDRACLVENSARDGGSAPLAGEQKCHSACKLLRGLAGLTGMVMAGFRPAAEGRGKLLAACRADSEAILEVAASLARRRTDVLQRHLRMVAQPGREAAG